jgi:predicted MPP superfamily phosphohydrolase
MCHQPVYYNEIAASGDYFVLSGHTHRGQIFPFHIFTKLFYPHFYGLEYIKNSAFYITSGAGTWGPPLRWLAKAEIPVITLTRAR